MKIDQSRRQESQSRDQQLASEHPFALYRGFSGPHFGVNHPFTNPYIEEPRQPRYLPAEKRSEIGKWFVKKFSINYWDAALFATGSFSAAKAYAGDFGSVGIIEPGEESSCSICWSPVYDSLFAELESRPQVPVADILDGGKYESFAWQEERKRHESILSGHELMVVAHSFRVAKWFNPNISPDQP
ncbi:MAG: hypothetical protein A3F73_01660 [Gallionellales bacterium RIFCSPLOWO2_12_FULL_59_22]|nr:MAG: hypothetical protein A3H99_12465 [Gallionellales bacterium RIFCSPLOWO2_02_FULL_59_110]OGT05077.1 MAG: hypothetical protein A2Z65_05595 [Gallionellales bacterium RIFCSPLOWO2_02_58_13]OGT12699.1 MAG: hypothetical protein A3F73_01660 [Gallionellales bacterium RIFCSPLOWO2_12_FULL_59_22]